MEASRKPLPAWTDAGAGLPTWIALIVLGAILSVASPHFLTVYNLSNVLLQAALTGFLALGLTPIIIAGRIDLTVGSLTGLAACLAVGLQETGLVLAVVATLGVGLGIGVVNGLLVEKLGIDSFIVTLAGMIGIRGLTFVYAGDSSLSPLDTRLMDILDRSVGPVSLIVVIFFVTALAFHLLLSQTRLGRDAYAIGGNERAAHDAGVRVQRTVIVLFALSGLMAAFCGIATAAHLNSATPVVGTNYELWAIISVVLGGTRLRGGAGGIGNTLSAVLLLETLRNGLNLLHVSAFWIPVVLGLCLIAALLIDRRATAAASD